MDPENKNQKINQVTRELPVKEKLGYGLGDFASVLFWQMITAYLLYFYTDVFGITAAAAGTMILISRLWDGINDPMMGMIADRTETRWGKFRPYLIWLSIPLAVIAVLAFTTPDLSGTAKLTYAYITFILFMMAYTAINIPYSSLLGIITPNSIERSSVASYKYVCAFLAGAVVSFFALPMANYLGGGNEAIGFQRTMMVFGGAAVVFFFITFISTNERVRPSKTQQTSIKQDLKDLLSNTPWVKLLFATLLMILFVSVRISVTTHYFKYYVEVQKISFLGNTWSFGYVKLASVFNGIGQLFAIVGVIFTKPIAKALGKKKAFIALFIIAIFSTGIFFVLRPQDLLLMFAFQIVGSFTGGPLTPLIWAMYADSADYSEWKKERRATGLVFSASTMSQKFGWAIGTAFTGWLLAFFGFEANVAQSIQVKNGLRALMSIIPAAAGILAVILMLTYKLDEKTMKNIEAELASRRDKEAEKELR
jgi:GPH family glycoside/pentoside/hexuronide:cation symporter